MAYQTFRQEYLQIPIVTRAYATACVITTLTVHLELVTPFQLYFNPTLILKQYQLWRLGTTFLFFGTFGFNFLFNMIFTYRYCRMLEEGSFRGRSADFVMMFLFGGFLMIIIAFFVNLLFLGQAFTIMLVYVWSRRNPFVRMNFFGILNFQAPYLPWVLLGFSILIGNTIWVDLIGIGVGHVYYFLEDIFPYHDGGCKLLKTPQFLKNIFDEPIEDPDYIALPEDRPGGFNWAGRPDVAQPPAREDPPPQIEDPEDRPGRFNRAGRPDVAQPPAREDLPPPIEDTRNRPGRFNRAGRADVAQPPAREDLPPQIEDPRERPDVAEQPARKDLPPQIEDTRNRPGALSGAGRPDVAQPPL